VRGTHAKAPPTVRSAGPSSGSLAEGGDLRGRGDVAARVHADRQLLDAGRVLERELAVHDVDLDVVARLELAREHRLAQAILDLALHGAAQRARTECRVEPDLDEALLGGLRQLDRHVAVEQTVAETLREQVDDLQQL